MNHKNEHRGEQIPPKKEGDGERIARELRELQRELARVNREIEWICAELEKEREK